MTGFRGRLCIVPALLACTETPAQYVRVDYDGVPAAWEARKLTLYVQDPSPRSQLRRDELLMAVTNAAQRWQAECRAFEISVLPSAGRAPVARDSVNVVSVQSERWCPAVVGVRSDCYDPRLEALTHVHKAPSRGGAALIEEADIELNAVDHVFSSANLEATLVHEMGHFLGLRHSCTSAKFLENSQLVPCQPGVVSAMHPDPKTRQGLVTPSADELRFVCDVYGGRRQGMLGRYGRWLALPVVILGASLLWLGSRAARYSSRGTR